MAIQNPKAMARAIEELGIAYYCKEKDLYNVALDRSNYACRAALIAILIPEEKDWTYYRSQQLLDALNERYIIIGATYTPLIVDVMKAAAKANIDFDYEAKEEEVDRSIETAANLIKVALELTNTRPEDYKAILGLTPWICS